MESKHRELLSLHRGLFVREIDNVQRLLPFLQAVLEPHDIHLITAPQQPNAQVSILLDVLSSKPAPAFQTLCVALESTHPQLLTEMFVSHSVTPTSSSASTSNSKGGRYQSPSAAVADPATSKRPDHASPPPPLPPDHTLPIQHAPVTSKPHNTSPSKHISRAEHALTPAKHSHRMSAEYAPEHVPRSSMDSKQQQQIQHISTLRPDYTSSPPPAVASSTPSHSHVPPTLVTKDLSTLRAAYALVPSEHIATQRAVLVPSKHMAATRPELVPGLMEPIGSHRDKANMPEEMQKCKLDHSDVNTKMGGASAPPPPIHDIDSLKAQCDWAMSELMALKLHQGETLKKCEQAVNDADLLRGTLKLTKDKNEGLERDVNLLKAQLSNVVSQRQRLESELEDERKQREADQLEIGELRKQQRDVMSESGSSEVLNMYDSAVDKYKNLHQEYEDMRKRYSDTLAQLTGTKGKVDLLQGENDRIRKQNKEVTMERNRLVDQHNILKQHLTASIQTNSKEKADTEKELQRTKIERDEYSKKVAVLKNERDAVLHEYSLVMSERKTVHREIESLENKLEEENRKYEYADKEKKSLSEEVDKTRRDLSLAAQEKDRLQKQLGEAHEKYDEMVDGERGKRDSLIKEFERKLETIPHLERDKERTSSERYKDRAARKDSQKEIDSLKRDVERLQAELEDCRQELEDAKKTRDWMFTEREKIVRERESVKTLCDNMRHERDDIVSSYMEAVKDADELKKQKADAQREIKQLKEQYDALREKQLHHSNSNDSAIDSDDVHDQPSQNLHILLEDVNSHEPGFELVGGTDSPQYPHDPSIYVSNIRPDSKAYSKLRANDLVLTIDNLDVSKVDRKVAVQALKSCGNRINMIVRRKKPAGQRAPYLVHLRLSPEEDSGLSMEQGLYVRQINPNSPAAHDSNMAEGDRILSINGQPVDEHMSLSSAQQMVRQSQLLTLQLLRHCLTHSLNTSSSLSSGGNLLLTESSPDALSLSPKSPHHHLMWMSDYTPHKDDHGLKSSGSQTDSLDSPQPRARRGGRALPLLPTHDSIDNSSGFSPGHQYDSSQHSSRSGHSEKPAQYSMGSVQQQHRETASSPQYSHQQESSSRSAQPAATMVTSPHGSTSHKPPTPHYNSPTRQQQQQQQQQHSSRLEANWGSRHPDQTAAATSHSYQTTSQHPPSLSSSSSTYSHHHMADSDRHHVPSSSSEPASSAPHKPPSSSQHALASSHPRKERSTERIIDSHHGHTYDHKQSSTLEKSRNVPPDKETIFIRAKKAISRPFADRAERDNRSKSSVVETFYTANNEEEIIAGLDEILNQHEGHGKKDRRYRNNQWKENSHGGTWPKARPHDGVSKAEKERPPIASAMLGNESRYPDASRTNKAPPTPPERNDSFKLGSHIKHSPQSSDASACSVKYNPMFGVPSQPLPVQPESPTNSRKRKQTPVSYAPVQSKPPAPPTAFSGSSTTDSKTKASTATAASGSQSSIISSSSGGFNSNKHAPRLSSSKVSSPEAMSPDYTVSYGKYTLPTDRRPRPDRPNSAPSRTRKQKEHKRHLAAMIHGSSSQERNPPPSSLDIQPVFSPGSLPPPPPPSSGYPPLYTPGSNKSSVSSFGSLTGPLSPGQPMEQQKAAGGLPPPHLLRSSNVPYHTAIRGYGSPPTYFPEMPPPPPQQPGEAIGERGAGFNRFSSPSPSPSLQSSSAGGGGHDSLTTSDGEFHGPPLHRSHDITATTTFLPPRRPLPIGDSSSGGRVHIPSSHSIMSSSNASAMSASVSSWEGRLSERSSPTSPFVTGDLHHTAASSSTDSYGLSAPSYPTRRPDKGETRNINVEKSSEPLGIKIDTSNNGGIFVSSVNYNSLARKAGVQIGDQLLEVCGINLRTATYDDAARILRQCDGSINMLVQYNPNNYQDADAVSSEESSCSDDDGTGGVHRITLSRTPSHRISNDTITAEPSASPSHGSKGADSFPAPVSEPRFVILKNPGSCDNLGFTLIGGNAVGIFVQTVQQNSIASGPNGLKCGDQILEFNGTNFRCVTAEQAAIEVARPADSVAILAQYNFAKHTKIQEQPGDAVYVRALYEHGGEGGELSFAKNDILFVDNTMYQGQLGMWRAWRVDNQGNKLCCGTVWSKAKLEEDFAARYSNSELGMEDELKGSRRGSGLARRSFFRRQKKHQRNNSKDSRDLSSVSDASLTSDSVPFLDSDGCMMTYERVERLDSSVCRPVLIIGPLHEPLINKLTSESPDKYCRIEPEVVKASMSFLETGQHDGAFVDFKARSDGSFECITVQSVKEIIDKGRHCMLSCSPSAIETLHKVHIYPIVLFIKHKSAKQIREARDTRFLPEKLPSKIAKELYDTYAEYETKYKRYFSDIIQGGNLAFMCYKIKGAINKESKKALWVQSGAL